jgi:hypothetical protein
MGRLGAAEANAAKAELAREVMRYNAPAAAPGNGGVALWMSLPLIAIIALGSYAWPLILTLALLPVT